MSSDTRRFDAIVIGSGIGGLAAAASLAKCGRRVLVLEQHFQLGGLTQAFTRQDYTFATGVHYVGGVGEAPGPDNRFGRLLRWLTDGRGAARERRAVRSPGTSSATTTADAVRELRDARHEASTPLSQASFVLGDRGAMYGIEMSAERISDKALRIRTPVPGLLLAGQDATGPGIQGAFVGGFMAAASLEPRLWRQMLR